MGLLMEGELFHETLDLVQCTFCHIRLLPKNNVYCITRSPHQEVCPLCVLEAIAVGQPVTRLPPHRSRRAVFPHRALQADSLPQSSLGLRSDPSRFRAPDEARPFDLNVAEQLVEAWPCVASPLAAAI
jgi:hypothetical protein